MMRYTHLKTMERADLHSLCANNAELASIVSTLQSHASSSCASSLPDIDNESILVTGSAGYLGRTLVLTLRNLRDAHNLNLSVVGIDIIPGDTVDIVLPITGPLPPWLLYTYGPEHHPDPHLPPGDPDVNALLQSILEDHAITIVLATAALHAPHGKSHSEDQFVAVNIGGTAAMMDAVAAEKKRRSSQRLSATPKDDVTPDDDATHKEIVVVHTSTTSLMVTQEVKAQEAALHPDELLLLGPMHPKTQPRNRYGRSKLGGETVLLRAAAAHGIPAIILRMSRFFPEVDFRAGLAGMSSGNAKALELLGRRLSLRDATAGVLLAASKARSLRSRIFVLSAPSPFLPSLSHSVTTSGEGNGDDDDGKGKEQGKEDVMRVDLEPLESERVAAIFDSVGWLPPSGSQITRVYDVSTALSDLGWSPIHTWDTLLDALDDTTSDGAAWGGKEFILNGWY